MDATGVIVVLGGIVLIYLVLWYFLWERGEVEEMLIDFCFIAVYECPKHPHVSCLDENQYCPMCSMGMVRRGAGESIAGTAIFDFKRLHDVSLKHLTDAKIETGSWVQEKLFRRLEKYFPKWKIIP